MLYCITGKQRAGKSYFCVTVIQDYLRSCNRPIYSNLPLHPDIICRLLFRSPAKYALALRRIHLFRKFRSFGEAREFYKKNPDWCKLHQVIPDDAIKEFWRHTEANSVIILDELYQYFNSADYRDRTEEIAARRRELLAYTRQHGHYKDDMFLISHSANDLDTNIRRGIQYLYVVSNSKYSNVFEKWSWLKGLKWPVQFFRIRGYEYGETDYSDQWALWPSKRIFRCYDSFSRAESVPGKSLPSEDAASTDTGTNVIKNVLHFLRCVWIPLFIGLSVVFGVWRAYHKYVDFVSSSSSAVSIGQVPGREVHPVQPERQPEEQGEGEYIYLSPLSITPSMLIYPNNLIFKRGDVIDGKTISKITRSQVVFADGSVTAVAEFCRIRKSDSGADGANRAGTAGAGVGIAGTVRR